MLIYGRMRVNTLTIYANKRIVLELIPCCYYLAKPDDVTFLVATYRRYTLGAGTDARYRY